MPAAPIPRDETTRLLALASCRVLDTPPEATDAHLDERVVRKALVVPRVVHDQGLGLKYRVTAEGERARRLVDRQADLGLEPLAFRGDEADEGDGGGRWA